MKKKEQFAIKKCSRSKKQFGMMSPAEATSIKQITITTINHQDVNNACQGSESPYLFYFSFLYISLSLLR